MSTTLPSPRILPFLWFDANAEEAVDFYLGIFKNSRRLDEFRDGDGALRDRGRVLTIGFELDGQRFVALNGGPRFQFNEAVSFVVRCDSQDEIDHYWAKLASGGQQMQCGWLKDPYGVCWQVVPARMGELIRDPRAMQAMLKMTKIEIAELERAAGS